MVGLLFQIIISKPIFLRLNVYLKNNTKQIPKSVCVVRILTKKIISRMDIEKKNNIVIQSFIKQRILIRMTHYNKQLIKVQTPFTKTKN